MTKNKIRSFIDSVIKMREIATDEQAVEIQNIYPAWKPDVQYESGKRVLYNDVLYKVITAHTSASEWPPDAAVSLFAKVLITDPDVIPNWEQPESTNPYMTGDKVIYDGKIYVSIIDNNVWKPTDYGWELVE